MHKVYVELINRVELLDLPGGALFLSNYDAPLFGDINYNLSKCDKDYDYRLDVREKLISVYNKFIKRSSLISFLRTYPYIYFNYNINVELDGTIIVNVSYDEKSMSLIFNTRNIVDFVFTNQIKGQNIPFSIRGTINLTNDIHASDKISAILDLF